MVRKNNAHACGSIHLTCPRAGKRLRSFAYGCIPLPESPKPWNTQYIIDQHEVINFRVGTNMEPYDGSGMCIPGGDCDEV